jgi:hypothetical protein
MPVVSDSNILRRILSQQQVKALLQTIQTVEKMVITQEQLDKIFAPYYRKR